MLGPHMHSVKSKQALSSENHPVSFLQGRTREGGCLGTTTHRFKDMPCQKEAREMSTRFPAMDASRTSPRTVLVQGMACRPMGLLPRHHRVLRTALCPVGPTRTKRSLRSVSSRGPFGVSSWPSSDSVAVPPPVLAKPRIRPGATERYWVLSGAC
jgi:hypothetical protein